MYKRYNKRRNNQRTNRTLSGADLARAIEYHNSQKNVNTDTFYEPQNSFEDFKISEVLKINILNKNFKTPTPIQDKAIPAILEGKDVIGIANTGTGKTIAFLTPLLDKVYKNKNEKVLIITPTRELATQIMEEFKYFSQGLGVYACLCIGGVNIARQIRSLHQGSQFVIGTPGRIKDLMTQRALDLSTFNNVVLDETDRMVEIGFIQEIRYFIDCLPKQRQSLFFSATISDKVRGILQQFVHDPVTISVKQNDASENIEQKVIRIDRGVSKLEKLHDLLIQKEVDKVVIFGETKRGVQNLADELNNRGFRAGSIHGNKRQSQRQRTLNEFKQNKINILIATDVASRGLDIDNVSHVVNYELPNSYDDYIHRIGRTGRADKKGIALTFIN